MAEGINAHTGDTNYSDKNNVSKYKLH